MSQVPPPPPGSNPTSPAAPGGYGAPQAPAGGSPIIEVKPKPDIYSVLVIVAILVLAVGLFIVANNLLGVDGYGMELGDLFQPGKALEAPGR